MRKLAMIIPLSVFAFAGVSATTASAGTGSGMASTTPAALLTSRETPSTATPVQDAVDAVDAYLDRRSGIASVAVFDNVTGETWSSSDETFETASIVKLAILEATVLRSQEEGRPLIKTERSMIAKMISVSDNASATRLWDAAGGAEGMAQFFDRIGATSTVTSASWGLTKTTAVDQLTVVRLFAYENDTLTDESREVVRAFLDSVVNSQRWGVSAGVVDAADVKLKNGWLPRKGGWVINSVGHVNVDGHDYVIAALSKASKSQRYGIDTVEGLSTIVWNSSAVRQ